MCILFIKLLKAAKPGEFKLILASNRDEFFKRPGRTAHFWDEDDKIFGGRDMTKNKKGGTWLAMSKRGKLGVLLNVAEKSDFQKLGRGFLVANYLKSYLTDMEYLKQIEENGHRYNKFHLITASLGPQPRLFHFSNGNGSGIKEVHSEIFAAGNSPLKTPFQKVIKGKERFEEICGKFGKLQEKEKLVENLLSLLKWEEKHYPDEAIDSLTHLLPEIKPSYSAVFVNAPKFQYGTRTHTIILVDWNGKAEFHEWTLKEPVTVEHMEWEETHEHFNISPDATSQF